MANILDEVVAAGKPLYDKATRHAIRMNKIANRVNRRKVPLGYIERDGNFYLPSEYVEPRPHREYITRYHNTGTLNANEILKGTGIKPSKSYGGAEGVYTTAHPTLWSGYKRPVQMELEIPKNWYVEHAKFDDRDSYLDQNMVPYGRYVYEPFVDDNSELWKSKIGLRVYDGGRTSVFDDEIPKDFIRRVCYDKGTPEEKCFDGKSLELLKMNY